MPHGALRICWNTGVVHLKVLLVGYIGNFTGAEGGGSKYALGESYIKGIMGDSIQAISQPSANTYARICLFNLWYI